VHVRLCRYPCCSGSLCVGADVVCCHRYACHLGHFYSSGDVTKVCSPTTGGWSGAPLSCVACSPPAPPAQATMLCDATGGVCEYSCHLGWFLSSGAASRTCSVGDGTWSGEAAVCQACSPPLPNTHVVRTCTSGECSYVLVCASVGCCTCERRCPRLTVCYQLLVRARHLCRLRRRLSDVLHNGWVMERHGSGVPSLRRARCEHARDTKLRG